MNLDFSASALISNLIFSVIGLWLFREGRRRLNYKVLIIGICLMVCPYFTSGPWQDWGVGIALCFMAYTAWL